MIDLIRALKGHVAYGRRLLAFAPAFLVSEFFYKFHSFALECLAFLATWLVLDILIELVTGKPKSAVPESRPQTLS